MALNKNDIQILREVFRPEFERLHQRIDKIEKRFDAFKLYVDKRFEKVDERFDKLENSLLVSFRQIIEDVYQLHPTRDEFNSLQSRVVNLENKLQRQSS